MGDIQFYGGYVNAQQAAASRLGAPAADLASAESSAETPAGEGADAEFTFGDFLDIINPLQHIPIVSTLYREITGDEISAPARVFGGTLFGGPGGFVAAVANTLFDEVAGEDLGATAVALFDGEEAPAEPQLANPPSGPDSAGSAAAGATTASGAMTAAPLITAAGATPSVPARDTNAPAGPLTGQDALNALFNDLHGGGRAPATPSLPAAAAEALTGAEPTSPSAPPKQSTAVVPPTPTAAPNLAQAAGPEPSASTHHQPAAHPQMMAAGAPEAAFAQQMMQALDKYQAMAGQRPGAIPGNAPDETRSQPPKP
ncbi:hypothetical protein [Pelagibius sp.]|uniref:hypothetical protein n=1 Tax=Pelagibius sp. TaxID=1931238 RepID=UPI00262D8A7B|nr:hypothetical protein [Pelagibius sp.]